MSRTLKQAIDEADGLKPNPFTNDQKTTWISSLEGRILKDIWLMDEVEFTPYSYTTQQNTELLAQPPHDDIYVSWLIAQIDFANGEYGKYQNSLTMFNAAYGDYVQWFASRYEPAQGYNTDAARPIPETWL